MSSNRGFASMSPERVKEIASMGGKAAHANGTAHQFTSEEAKVAGRKGGLRARKRKFTEPQYDPGHDDALPDKVQGSGG
jgi:general stress protein YciG